MSDSKSDVRSGMTAEEIKAAGLAVDLPFEAPESSELEYADGETLLEKHPELLDPKLGGKGALADE